MSTYRKLWATFWTGDTGRRLRSYGRDVQLLAAYLITGPDSNMIGLYNLALPTLCHHLGMTPEGASKALRSLSEGDFSYYDEDEETVWVPEMAAYQIGATLKATDKQITGVVNLLREYRKSRFFNDFLRRYGEAYHLKDIPEFKALPRPSEGPSKALRSQEQIQEQEEESLAAEKPPHTNGTPRKRNELWDAVVKITGADETIPRAKGAIGKTCKELNAAKPPYTAADVLALPQAIARAGMDFKITVSSIPNHIHLVRQQPDDTAKQDDASILAERKATEARKAARAAAGPLSIHTIAAQTREGKTT